MISSFTSGAVKSRVVTRSQSENDGVTIDHFGVFIIRSYNVIITRMSKIIVRLSEKLIDIHLYKLVLNILITSFTSKAPHSTQKRPENINANVIVGTVV